MNCKLISYGLVSFLITLGWNVFLIQRDKKMFDAYDKAVGIERINYPTSNSLKTWCERQKGEHPDCIN